MFIGALGNSHLKISGKKKPSASRLGLTSHCWKHGKFKFFAASNLCVSKLEKDTFLCLEQEINSTRCQYHLFPRLTIDCITSLEISFHFFPYLYSRLVFTFEALGGKVSSSRQKILKAFEFMFFTCRSL